MPVKGGKVYDCKNEGTCDTSGFQIPYTGESFSSIDAYQCAMKEYERRDWSCQCTGKTGLTFKLALDSETNARQKIASQFPKSLYKPILTAVHHCCEPMDMLLARAYELISNEFFVDEDVVIRQKPDYIGKVTCKSLKPKVSPNGDTPPSDKENSKNKSGDLVYAVRVQRRNSNVTDTQAKVVSDVPAAALKRPQSLTKELLKMFIKCYAMKQSLKDHGMLWIVNGEMLQLHEIKDKMSNNSLPHKMSKKSFLDDSKNTPKLNGNGNKIGEVVTLGDSTDSETEKLPKKDSKDSDSDECSKSSSSEDEAPARNSQRRHGMAPSSANARKQIKQRLSQSSRPKSALKPVKGQMSMSNFVTNSKGVPLISLSDSDTEDSKQLNEFAAKKTPNNLNNIKKKKAMATLSLKKSMSMQQKTPKNKQFTIRSKSVSKPAKSSEDSEDDKCLASIARTFKKKISSPTKNRGYTPSTELQKKRLLSTVAQGAKIIAQFGLKHRRFMRYLKINSQLLNMKQIDSIDNEVIRDKLKNKVMRDQERELTKNMTEEQLKQYRKDKSATAKLKQDDMKPQQREDTILSSLTSLPTPDVVLTPEVLPNEYFGEVVVVVEFLGAYHELLADKKTNPITTDELIVGLCGGKSGFNVVGRVLVTLLQTLLQDEMAQDYKELRMRVSKVPVDLTTAAELARICLREEDEEIEDEAENEGQQTKNIVKYDKMDPGLMQRLEEYEFCDLRPSEQLNVLSALVQRLLSANCVYDHQEVINAEFIEARKDYMNLQTQRKIVKPAEQTSQDITKFVEKSTPASSAGTPTQSSTSSRLSRRESLEIDRKRKEEEETLRKNMAIQKEIEDRFQSLKMASRMCTRVQSIGCDRNHNRYWLFSDKTPGLYVEKGWVSDYMDYNCNVESSIPPIDASPNKKRFNEMTVPRVSTNNWCLYNSKEQIDSLIKALHPCGIRESALKKQLLLLKTDILESVAKLEMKREIESKVKELRIENDVKSELSEEKCEENGKIEVKEAENGEDIDSDLKEEDSILLLGNLKKEVLDMEVEFRNSGFGGIHNFDEWVIKVNTGNDLKTLGELMIESMQMIEARFLKDLFLYNPANIPAQLRKDKRIISGRESWMLNVRECKTVSRMQVLHSILYLCVTWDKSAATARCLMCRRRGQDSQLLLCDDCFGAYHIYCLRPPLKKIPQGDWYCPTCKPKHTSKSRRGDTQSEDEAIDIDTDDENQVDRSKTKRRADNSLNRDREAKKRATSAIRAQERETSSEADLTGTRRSARNKHDESTEGEEEIEQVDTQVKQVIDSLMHSRSANTLQYMTLEEHPSTRSNRGKKVTEMNLKMVLKKLASYKNVKSLFLDLNIVVETAKTHFADQSRKLTQVEDFETKIGQLQSEFDA